LLLTDSNRLDTKYPYVCHAELNAILNKNSADVKGCTLYVALFPCNECTKLIIQSGAPHASSARCVLRLIDMPGIRRIFYVSDKYHDKDEFRASRRLLDMAKVEYWCVSLLSARIPAPLTMRSQYTPRRRTITIDFGAIDPGRVGGVSAGSAATAAAATSTAQQDGSSA
jgi:dCMP deaminase